MRMVDIIEKKRDNHVLSEAEIRFWIEGVTDNSIPEYQTSALLMAIVLNGMNNEETTILTDAMLHSGDIIDLSAIEGHKVDKHSTGGVGDKTTLILSPIVAAAGGKIAKMSGRGLGHTGGTLDKLESIAGYQVELSKEDFMRQVNELNIAVVGQSGNLVYADKVLYGLRDVTGTVNSIPLIAASVMSKKLAGGADCIFLDVKYGEGAFMKTIEDAKTLANTMIHIGETLGRRVNAMISNMNQPLGNTIGNALEVYEAALTLQNKGPKDLEDLCVVAAGYLLYQAGFKDTPEEGYVLARETLQSGAAYDVFLKWIEAQHGDVSVFEDLDGFIAATYKEDVIADEEGFVHELHALELGLASMHLGAGRETKEDVIDFKAGITLKKDVGDYVNKGDVLATIQSSTPFTDKNTDAVKACFVLGATEVTKPDLIAEIL